MWTDALIIEEYKSDSDNDSVSNVQEDKEKPSFAFTDSVTHVKTFRENIKQRDTTNNSPKIENHLIKDYDFHEKRIAKQAELTKSKNKVIGQRENRPVWNNVQRVNHQNKFVPSVLLTKTGKFLVNAARQNYSSQAASTRTAIKVNNVRPFVNESRPKRNFYKTRSPNKRPFYKTTAQRTTFSYQKFNAVRNISLNAVRGNGILLLRPQHVVIGDTKEILETKSSTTTVDQSLEKVALKDKGIVDSGCSKHMTGNKAHLANYQEFKGGSVAFEGSNRRITGKGKIKVGRLDFEDVYYVEELKHYNLFFVTQMCDKKNKVLFTETDCLVLSPNFKLLDENQLLLKIPRQHNMYSFNLKNINPFRDLSCLFAKASIDESNKWHRMFGHVNFKNLNKCVKGNLVRGIKREYSNARTPQQNGVAERKNRTFIEAARTMLADSLLPTTFWAEAVNTACYVLNRVLVTKPQNKTPYKLLTIENQANKFAGPKEANNSTGTQANDDQGVSSEEINLHEKHFVVPIWSAYSTTIKSSGDKIEQNTDFKTCEKPVSQVEQIFLEELEKLKRQEKEANDAAESLRKEATHYIQNANPSITNLLNIDIYASPSEGIFTDLSYYDEDLPFGKKPIRTKWVYKNKKDERGVVVRNEARLVTQGHRQEEGIDFDEKSCCNEFEELMKNRFQMSSMGELTFFLGLQVKKKEDGIFISHDKYVAEILKKFDFLSVKTASTPIETQKPLV
uniref:Ribonuclease H-like domain-containing protein n=1 Tax=Tanacetum cinerariifolium TaxID=118510 RepID=A0A699IIB7_TANCI|nr:ribonuclease H-like domain-containing protein [Tanacetum cinerariifolium]